MKYYLLDKQPRRGAPPVTLLLNPTAEQLTAALPDGFYALDLETKGTDPTDPSCEIVGAAFANNDRCVYVNFRTLHPDATVVLQGFLRRNRLTAFNVNFDGGFLYRFTGQWLDWVGCSYGLFKQLSSEGWSGQSWNLETAQQHVLGWDTTNKEKLAAELKARGLKKEDLWKLPDDIIGEYCGQDAIAAWQLWQHLAAVCREREFDLLLTYHQREFLTEIRLLIEQQFRGILIDRNKLSAYHGQLEQRIAEALSAFLQHPQVSLHVEAYNQEVRDAWRRREPARETKKGEVSKRWTAWKESEARFFEDNEFNVDSDNDLRWLFYERLGNPITRTTDTGKPTVDKKILPTFGEPGRLLVRVNRLTKEEAYIRACLAIQREGVLHPQNNSCGTVTGRLSGGADDE